MKQVYSGACLAREGGFMPPTYYKNHHEGLRHYEEVAWSRISLVSNDRPDT
jgi:hypothetical protein